MESIQVLGPGFRQHGRRPTTTTEDGRYRDPVGVVRMKAQIGIESCDAILAAAAARKDAGSWEPSAARNFREFEQLARAQDIAQRHRRSTANTTAKRPTCSACGFGLEAPGRPCAGCGWGAEHRATSSPEPLEQWTRPAQIIDVR